MADLAMPPATRWTAILGAGFLLAVVWMAEVRETASPSVRQAPVTEMNAVFRYHPMAEADVIAGSDLIVHGEVVSVSDVYWNQDSGLAWEANAAYQGEERRPVAMPLQHVTLAVESTLADTTGDGTSRTVEFTVPGTDIGHDTGSEGEALAPGKVVVVFLAERDLAWREGGRRRHLTLSGAYQGVYEILADGLVRNASGKAGMQRSHTIGGLLGAIEEHVRASAGRGG
jgi:hypothetical protein